MERYSKYGEQRFRQQFELKFDFMNFHKELDLSRFTRYVYKNDIEALFFRFVYSGCEYIHHKNRYQMWF
ncbi:hypothetical protein [Parabacteroides sp. FAFU027]|uniref:hypothetical protein n=1 Tax=Parabacteroides sp. FAFU027 TaxID=2922715 RepID=UPI001FB04757|nr:hypothetical protein [Parabacteroides sp. FAFU027]